MSQQENPEGPASPAIDFTAFVLSLSTAALQHLGETTAEEGSSDQKANLDLAKQTIDILAMLEAKTTGNLTAEESKLLGHILYDLRMRFVERARGASG